MKKTFTLLLGLCVLVSCNEDEFLEKDYIETFQDRYNRENPTGDLENDFKIAKYNCEVAEEENDIEQTTFRVDFPAAIECEFNEGGSGINDLNVQGNAPRIDALITARIKQDQSIDLSAGTTICDMEFNFPEQNMQYDDEIFLLVNDYVVMSSQDYSESDKHPNGLKKNAIGLQQYDWSGENGLLGLDYIQYYTPQFCLGVDNDDPDYATKCNIPATETFGQMKLEIPKTEIVKLGLLSEGVVNRDTKTKLDFSFVTTGDNDNGDCEHAAYSYEVTVKHVNIYELAEEAASGSAE